jgi:WD40 repeat protein
MLVLVFRSLIRTFGSGRYRMHRVGIFHCYSRVTSLAWSVDGTQLVTGQEDLSAVLRKGNTGQYLGSVHVARPVSSVAHVGGGGSKSFILSQVTSSSVYFRIDAKRWLTIPINTPKTTSASCMAGSEGGRDSSMTTPRRLSSIAMSSDGSKFVAWTREGSAWIGSTLIREPLMQINVNTGIVSDTMAMAISNDGSVILSASGNYATVWFSAANRPWLQLEGHTRNIRSLSLSDLSLRAVSADDSTVRLWCLRSGRELFCLNCSSDTVLSAALSRDGSRIAVGHSDGRVQVWKVGEAEFRASVWICAVSLCIIIAFMIYH